MCQLYPPINKSVFKILSKYSYARFKKNSGLDGKESACNAGDPGSIPGMGRFPWRREWLPTPVFLP